MTEEGRELLARLVEHGSMTIEWNTKARLVASGLVKDGLAGETDFEAGKRSTFYPTKEGLRRLDRG